MPPDTAGGGGLTRPETDAGKAKYNLSRAIEAKINEDLQAA